MNREQKYWKKLEVIEINQKGKEIFEEFLFWKDIKNTILQKYNWKTKFLLFWSVVSVGLSWKLRIQGSAPSLPNSFTCPLCFLTAYNMTSHLSVLAWASDSKNPDLYYLQLNQYFEYKFNNTVC